MPSLSRIVLNGYKSIAQCDLELTNLNVLIGPNGAGKSNFIQFFTMMQQLAQNSLALYVGVQGGPDTFLRFGRKKTPALDFVLYFKNNEYHMILVPTLDNNFVFGPEVLIVDGKPVSSTAGHSETKLTDLLKDSVIKKWRVYHFHDTGETACVKGVGQINDNVYLRYDAKNLAAFLYLIKKTHPIHYDRIVSTIRLAMPFFDDFHLRPTPDNKNTIELEWVEKGHDIPWKAHYFSDGTLRFICLTTALLQPEEYLPDTIIIDEPELGLHPFAIHLLAAMLRSISKSKQVIIATQSVELLNEFKPEDVIVVDRTNEGSHLRRLDSSKLEEWLEEYSLGELWEKNVIGGGPFV